ncbi:hypothetical protein FIBSPDRAFT_571322 [Athelia psychrophila]|uniref:Uncharacterized protein n=1 Tax=Athelia psychrophila TaxID=1759441 RepID=A0A166HT67_9AGAM|nr:hypothetical protein FIBSPDRAFT_571322 [Fibularhizoctonia sp. CBS 109695]
MPLALLLVSLSLLQGCIAPAVSNVTANYAPPFPDTTSSLAPSDSTSGACNSIHSRTMASIITSCLTTIFACVWVSVHPNVPGPRQSWKSKQFESFKIVVLMLLVPEWVFAWAVRQRLQAGHYADILERARVAAADEATLQHNRNSTDEGHTARSSSSDQEIGEQAAAIRLEERSTPRNNLSTDITGSISELTTGEMDNERESLIGHQFIERSTPVPPELASKLANLCKPFTVDG